MHGGGGQQGRQALAAAADAASRAQAGHRLRGTTCTSCCRVAEVAPPAITLEPHPDPLVHPLAYRRALRRAQRQAAAAAAGEEEEGESEEEEGEQGWGQCWAGPLHAHLRMYGQLTVVSTPASAAALELAPAHGKPPAPFCPTAAEPGSQYDEAGRLVAELASFVELRLLQPAPGKRHGQQPVAAPAAPAATAAVAAGTAPGVAAEGGSTAADELGPSSYSQLGPPRPASRGDVIAAEGGWASLYEQLRQRRLQLAGQPQQPGAAAVAGTPQAAAKPAGSEVAAVRSAPPATRRENSSGRAGGPASGSVQGRGSLTPGATRPRAGVRRTALGPMLRLLRESQELS